MFWCAPVFIPIHQCNSIGNGRTACEHTVVAELRSLNTKISLQHFNRPMPSTIRSVNLSDWNANLNCLTRVASVVTLLISVWGHRLFARTDFPSAYRLTNCVCMRACLAHFSTIHTYLDGIGSLKINPWHLLPNLNVRDVVLYHIRAVLPISFLQISCFSIAHEGSYSHWNVSRSCTWST